MTAREVFEQLVGTIDYPMFIVTTVVGEHRAGCLVGFVTQCSINPPRLLVCMSKKNHTFRVAAGAESLAVHFLGPADEDLSELFGEQSGDSIDKFQRCRWKPGPGGLPILDVERGWVAARVLDRFDVNDHVAFLVEPFDGTAHDAGVSPLGFQQVRDMVPGHEA